MKAIDLGDKLDVKGERDKVRMTLQCFSQTTGYVVAVLMETRQTKRGHLEEDKTTDCISDMRSLTSL